MVPSFSGGRKAFPRNCLMSSIALRHEVWIAARVTGKAIAAIAIASFLGLPAVFFAPHSAERVLVAAWSYLIGGIALYLVAIYWWKQFRGWAWVLAFTGFNAVMYSAIGFANVRPVWEALVGLGIVVLSLVVLLRTKRRGT